MEVQHEHIVVHEQVVVRQLRMEIIRRKHEHVVRRSVQREITVQEES